MVYWLLYFMWNLGWFVVLAFVLLICVLIGIGIALLMKFINWLNK